MPVFLLASPAAQAGDVDTQYIFGFTQGSDVGELGEREIEWATVGRFGKADGSYAMLASQLRAELTPFENFRFEVGAIVNYAAISGVSAPVGLTISAEPHWTRIDDASGELVASYGSEFVVAIDKELVANRLFAAFKLRYDPEWTHVLDSDAWQQQSTMGISAALTAQVEEGVFFGHRSSLRPRL